MWLLLWLMQTELSLKTKKNFGRKRGESANFLNQTLGDFLLVITSEARSLRDQASHGLIERGFAKARVPAIKILGEAEAPTRMSNQAPLNTVFKFSVSQKMTR